MCGSTGLAVQAIAELSVDAPNVPEESHPRRHESSSDPIGPSNTHVCLLPPGRNVGELNCQTGGNRRPRHCTRLPEISGTETAIDVRTAHKSANANRTSQTATERWPVARQTAAGRPGCRHSCRQRRDRSPGKPSRSAAPRIGGHEAHRRAPLTCSVTPSAPFNGKPRPAYLVPASLGGFCDRTDAESCSSLAAPASSKRDRSVQNVPSPAKIIRIDFGSNFSANVYKL